MQADSRLTPNGGNTVMSNRRPHVCALTAETDSTMAANWLQKAEEGGRDHAPIFPKALSVNPVRILIVAKFGTSIQIATLLHSMGAFDTRIACSADPALNIALDFLPNIVLMSIDLPDLESYRVASTLRWRSGSPCPRLIALTDDIPGTDRGRALAAGFEQYLTVPVQQAALESALVRRLGRHSCRGDRGDSRSARLRLKQVSSRGRSK
jgi:CheY-like chemotaxis protein